FYLLSSIVLSWSSLHLLCFVFVFFFFTDPSTTEIYTLSLHDALPILGGVLHVYSLMYPGWTATCNGSPLVIDTQPQLKTMWIAVDRKSTRLNSSHRTISYAVFCLKKKNKKNKNHTNKLIHIIHPSIHK